jgi:hypothetical protein
MRHPSLHGCIYGVSETNATDCLTLLIEANYQ